MIIVNIKVDADDTSADVRKSQLFKADIEIYDGKNKIDSSTIHSHNFRILMDKALKVASKEKNHYEMLKEKVKVQVDWEQYTFEYDNDTNKWGSDQGISFQKFLGIFDESIQEKQLPAKALNDFLDNLLFDHSREAFSSMDDDQKLVVKYALSYGMNVLGDTQCESKSKAAELLEML